VIHKFLQFIYIFPLVVLKVLKFNFTAASEKLHLPTARIRQSTLEKTSSSAITERPRNTRVTLIRKIEKWNFWATFWGA